MARPRSQNEVRHRKVISTKSLFGVKGQSKILNTKTRIRKKSASYSPHRESSSSPLHRVEKKRLEQHRRRSTKHVHPISKKINGWMGNIELSIHRLMLSADVFDRSRESIRREATGSLDTSMLFLNKRFSEVKLQADKVLKESETLHEAVTKPFTAEQLQLTTSNPDGTHAVEAVSLMDRLQEHRLVMKTAAKELDALWRQWTRTRQDFCCLGVEVLGLEAFDLITWAGDVEFQTRLGEAADTFHTEQDLSKEIQSGGVEFEQEVKEFTRKSIEEMNASQKEWKRETKGLKTMIEGREKEIKKSRKDCAMVE